MSMVIPWVLTREKVALYSPKKGNKEHYFWLMDSGRGAYDLFPMPLGSGIAFVIGSSYGGSDDAETKSILESGQVACVIMRSWTENFLMFCRGEGPTRFQSQKPNIIVRSIPHVKALSLQGLEYNDKDAKLFAESPHLAHLETLDVRGTDIEAEGLTLLKAKFKNVLHDPLPEADIE